MSLEPCFGDLIATEGTYANGTMPNRQHTSATPSSRAAFTPNFQNNVPFWKKRFQSLTFYKLPYNNSLIFTFMQVWRDLRTWLRRRGRMRKGACQIGSIHPRRQARGRRSLHPFKSIRFDVFHSLTNMWRFGFGVRENVGKKVRDHVRQRAVRTIVSVDL